MIKRLSILALILLLVGIIGSLFTMKTQYNQAETLKEKVVEKTDFTNIDIYTNNAEIIVLPTKDETAKIELLGDPSRYELTSDVKDNTLKVNLKLKREKIFSFDLFSSVQSLTVHIPQKVYENIQVESNNGRIELGDLEGNEIEVLTDNGRIELTNIAANLVKAKTNNGRIKMENIGGEIVGESDNGKISFITESLDQPIELQTDNGQIDVQSKNQPTNAVLDLKTDNGKVRVFGESNWGTVIGNGENIIKLTTGNGNITISN